MSLLVIVQTSSIDADMSEYTGLFGEKDKLVTVSGKDIVGDCNIAACGRSATSDVLFITDKVTLHPGLLENMRQCLGITEKHAIVCGQELALNLTETAEKYLPLYSRIIKPTADCVLIKGNIIDNLGFLDTSYESLQYALMDFYMRINTFGYTAVVAHHAMYSLKESGETPRASGKDKKLFNSKHTYYKHLENHYNRGEVHPCIKFLPLLYDTPGQKKKILFDCMIMPAFYNGTSEYQISMYSAFCRLFGDKYDIYMYVNHEADIFHELKKRFKNILFPDTIGDMVFHLGFVPNQLYFVESQIEINKRCLKVVQTVHDIIVLRCMDHQKKETQYTNIVRMSFLLCDGIITVSNYTKEDLIAFYYGDEGIDKIPVKPILNAAPALPAPKKQHKLPFKDYFLVIGNSNKHKAMAETVKAVQNTESNFIFVGYEHDKIISGSNIDGKSICSNIYGYGSGTLSDDFISYLYKNCIAIVFPSLYEGFGFPIAIALDNQKRIIVNNTATNRELFDYFTEFKDNFLFFDRFEQISRIIDNTDFTAPLKQIRYNDSRDRVATEAEEFFAQILETDIDVNKLLRRRDMYNYLETKLFTHKEFAAFDDTTTFKERFKNKHPRLFGFLKKLKHGSNT